MTLLIKSVRLLCSDHSPNESLDVFVNGGKISAIGNFPNKKADEVLDGQGAYLSPGFIDTDTTSDHYLSLFENPSQEDFLAQGVTTIIGGQCGSSLAPLITGSLISLRKWSDINSVNVSWHTLKELYYHLGKRRFGVNFGTLIGHSTIRRAITGGKMRDLTTDEIHGFSHILSESLKEGGLGFSTGLSYAHAKGTPYSELKTLAQIAKKNDAVYSTHLRKSKSGILESVEETIKLHKDTGVKTFISHFVPIKGAEDEYAEALKKIEEVDGDFHFGISPVPSLSVPLHSFLPDWAKSNFEKMGELISDPAMEEKLLRDMETVNSRAFVVVQALKNDFLVGKNLEELAGIFSVSNSKKALLKFMQITKLRAVIQYSNLSTKQISIALRSSRSLVSSHSPSFGKARGVLKTERSTSTFTQFLKFIQKEKLDIEESIRKLTSVPAKKFGIKGRGEIKEGNFADLTLFRNTDILGVVVNGEVSWRDGAFTGRSGGIILKKQNV